MNSTQLQGRLSQDPKFTKHGSDDSKDRTWCVLAVNRVNSDEADFIPFVTWGKLARAVANHCKKGKEVTIQGSIRSRMVEGVPRMEVRAHNVKFGADAKKNQAPTPEGPGLGKLNELIAGIVQKAITEKLGGALKSDSNLDAYSGDACPL
jgi:single-strand DNA-binding protein